MPLPDSSPCLHLLQLPHPRLLPSESEALGTKISNLSQNLCSQDSRNACKLDAPRWTSLSPQRVVRKCWGIREGRTRPRPHSRVRTGPAQPCPFLGLSCFSGS